jgi:hypothetical protein
MYYNSDPMHATSRGVETSIGQNFEGAAISRHRKQSDGDSVLYGASSPVFAQDNVLSLDLGAVAQHFWLW